jgi:hypothetical protein
MCGCLAELSSVGASPASRSWVILRRGGLGPFRVPRFGGVVPRRRSDLPTFPDQGQQAVRAERLRRADFPVLPRDPEPRSSVIVVNRHSSVTIGPQQAITPAGPLGTAAGSCGGVVGSVPARINVDLGSASLCGSCSGVARSAPQLIKVAPGGGDMGGLRG